MARQTSSAGPFRFRLDAIPSGESERIDTRSANAGPRDKKGGLRKFYGVRGGFDFVNVTNLSGLPVGATTNGGAGQDVPPATTAQISGTSPDGTPVPQATAYTFVEIVNLGGSTIAADDVMVSFGNGPRPEEAERESGFRLPFGNTFNPLTAIPGVNRNG